MSRTSEFVLVLIVIVAVILASFGLVSTLLDLEANHGQNAIANEPGSIEDSYRRRQVYIAIGLNAITLLAGIGGWIGLYILYGTLVATQQTAEDAKTQASSARIEAQAALTSAQTAQKQLELSQRAWVSIEIRPAGPITYTAEPTGGGIQMPLEYSLMDQGAGLAENVDVREKIFPYSMIIHAMAEQHALCEPLRGGYVPYNPGIAIFPNQTRIQGADVIVTFNEISAGCQKIQKTFKPIAGSSAAKAHKTLSCARDLDPVLVGCVNYTYSLSQPNHYHQTGFIYYVDGYDPKMPNAALGIDPNLTTSKWRLRDFGIGEAFYAD